MEDRKKMRMVPKDDRRLALVVVDMQKKFIVDAKDTTLNSIASHRGLMTDVIRRFREAGRPVIWVLYEGETHLEGITSETYEMIDGFEIAEGDHVVIKYHMNSFNNTNLSDIAQSYGCDAVLIMGMFAQYCVMATYWGAFDKGLSPYMMKGGLVSTDDRFGDMAYEICKTYDLEELESNLKIHGKK